MKSKILSSMLAVAFMATAVSGTVSVKAEEAPQESGTIYYDFQEITDASYLTVGEEYLFLNKTYNENEAVIDIPEGSAKLKYVSPYGEDADEYYYEWSGMYDADGNTWAQALVDVVERGSGFDYCTEGTIAYDTTGVVQAAYEAGEARYYIMDERPTFEEWYEENKDYCSEEYEWFTDLKTSDPEYYQEGLDYYGLEDGFTQEEFNEKYYESDTGYYIYASEGLDYPCWRYACSGGGVAYVGPFYLYSYKSTTFTAADLSVVPKNGYKTPKEETKLTTDDFAVAITLDGFQYQVPYFTIDSSNDTVCGNDGDLTVTINVGGVSKEVTVPDSANTYENEAIEAGTIRDITPSDSVTDGKAIFNADITDDEDYLQKALDLTDEEKALGTNVWLSLTDASSSISSEDKAAIDSLLTKELTDAKVGMYMDIDLFYKVAGEETTQVLETNDVIDISFTVPDEMINTDENVNRTYYMARIHNGAADLLQGVFDAATKKVSFKSDKFSVYALVYKDEVLNKVTTEKTTEAAEAATQTTEAPKTGDSGNALVYGLFMMAILVVIAGEATRRKNSREE